MQKNNDCRRRTSNSFSLSLEQDGGHNKQGWGEFTSIQLYNSTENGELAKKR